ncbi:MAG: hypothetical protein J6Y00_03330 [Paludibacteraceae bacterium]|nr:hypothetical protein [Paludibacteraceae bacterium]
MKHKGLLFLLFGGMALSLSAQQTRTGFVAIGQNGQQQNFLLENYPRLTLQTTDGVTTFLVHDIRNAEMSHVKTCVFGEVPLSSDIVLLENEDADYYTQFAEDYNGVTVNTATLNRQFTTGKWSTLCLPFDVRKALMMSLGLYGRVFEFKYAEVTSSVITAYFSTAQTIEAGKGYIVNANSKLSTKTSFVFPNVTIDTSGDNGDIATLQGHNDGTGRGNIYLVGTLRTGILHGSTYLGLKNNMIYHPNTTTGTVVRAYRGFFRSGTVIEEGGDEDPQAPQRVRIVVDGVESGEWTIDNEQLSEHSGAYKYIDKGILYIRSNGNVYNAQGQMIRER